MGRVQRHRYVDTGNAKNNQISILLFTLTNVSRRSKIIYKGAQLGVGLSYRPVSPRRRSWRIMKLEKERSNNLENESVSPFSYVSPLSRIERLLSL